MARRLITPLASVMQNSRISHQAENGRKLRASAMQKADAQRYRFIGLFSTRRRHSQNTIVFGTTDDRPEC